MIRTVISDLGRVLLWFDNNIFLGKIAPFCGKSDEEVRKTAHGNLGLIVLFDRGDISPEEFYERVSGALDARIGYDEFFRIYNDIFSLNPPVLDILRRVKKAGFGLILLSNTDVARFGFIRRTYPEIGIFDHMVLSYELRRVKPEPEIFEKAAALAGCRPEECVFIDDMAENVEAAVRFGMKGIRYLPDTDLAAELAALGVEI